MDTDTLPKNTVMLAGEPILLRSRLHPLRSAVRC